MTRPLTTMTTLLGVALAGCSVGPSYKRPELPIRETYRVEVPAQVGASIADLPWWEVYRDPVLQQLLREALQNNQDLALAAARVQEAGAFVGISKADLYPQLAAQLDGSWGRASRETFPGSANPNSSSSGLFTAALGLSWELDIWGRVRHSRDAALADLLSTEEGRRSVVLGLVASVASTYWQLRELDLELEIAQRNTTARQGTVDLFQQRSSGGVGNDLEVNQGQADLAVTAAAIPDTERQIALVEHQLCFLLARPPGPIERGEPLPAQFTPELPVGVPAALLQRRPDLVAAEQSLIAATERVGVAVADRLPKLSLVGSVGLESSSLGNLFKADAATWSIGGSLLAPIFQGGRLSALEDAARARMEQAVAVYRNSVLVALREVADAAVSYRKLDAVLVQVQLEVKATAAAERLARMRYDGGVASYLEVLDSQRQSYGAELSLARAQLARLFYSVQLYRALGGGWQERPEGGST